jgi:hypothetical protein
MFLIMGIPWKYIDGVTACKLSANANFKAPLTSVARHASGGSATVTVKIPDSSTAPHL